MGKVRTINVQGEGKAAATEQAQAADASALPDPEVSDKATRRKFTAEYKLRILREIDACGPGEIGAILRREGLYSSHLTKWRREREEAERDALTPKQRGRKPKKADPVSLRIAELEQQNQALQERLRQAEVIIEVQKKVSELLGIQSRLETGPKS